MHLSINDIQQNKSNIDISNNSLLNEMKNTDVNSVYKQQSDEDVKSFFDTTICDKWSLRNLVPYSLDSTLIKIEQEWQKINTIADSIKNTSYKDFSDSFNYIWDEIKNNIIRIYENILNEYHDIIIYFKGEYKSIVNMYKKLKNGTAQIETKELLLNELKMIGGDIYDMFQIYIIIDIIEEIWNAIKSPFGNSRNKGNNIINGLNNCNSILNDDEITKNSSNKFNNTISIITSIIKSVGIILITAIAIKEFIDAEREIAEKQVEDAANNQEPLISDNLLNILENISSIYESKAVNIKSSITFDNSSINTTDNNINNSNGVISCCPSICPVFDNNTNIQISNEGYIIEIGNDIDDYKLYSNINDFIEINQEIGHATGIPIKSIISGKVVSKNDRYLILQKNNIEYNSNGINTDEFIKKFENLEKTILETSKNDDSNTKLLNEFQEKITDMNNIESLFLYCETKKKKDNDPIFKHIIDILMRGNTIKNTSISSELSIKDDINKKKKEYKNIVDKMSDRINDICDVDNVKRLTKLGQEKNIKDQILFEKYKFIQDIQNLLISCFKKQESVSIDYNICDSLYEILMYTEGKNNKRFEELLSIIENAYNDKIIYEEDAINKLKKEFPKIGIDFNKIYSDLKHDISYDNVFNYIKTYITDFYEHIEDEYDRNNAISNIDNDTKKYTRLYLIIAKNQDKKPIVNNDILMYNINNKIAKNIMSFLNSLFDAYNNDKNFTKLDDLSIFNNLYNYISWPNPFSTYLNNGKYDHYLFTLKCISDKNIDNNIEYDDNFDNALDASGNYIGEEEPSDKDRYNMKTSYEISTFQYWLKYCGFATLMNCARVDKWPVGFIGPSGNVPLPVILIPIKYISGKVGVLLGIGICGIAVYPMVLMVNMTDVDQSILIPINLTLDLMRELLKELKETSIKSISESIINPAIKMLEEKIKETELNIKNIKNDILQFKSLEI